MRHAVIGIIFSTDRSQVLIVRRLDVDMWALPGGGIEPHESSEEAIIREIQEETGLRVTITRKVAEYTPLCALARFTHVYECTPYAGQLTTSPETRAVAFFPVNKLPDNFFHIHNEWLHDALKNHPDIIQAPISGVTYTKLVKYFCKHPIHVIRMALSRLGTPINKKINRR